jgi:Rap guanine nucleotide exchange factor 4
MKVRRRFNKRIQFLFLFGIVIFKVYCADHTYTTMKTRVDTPASRIIKVAADKLGLRCDQPDDLKLCEVKSTGGLFV